MASDRIKSAHEPEGIRPSGKRLTVGRRYDRGPDNHEREAPPLFFHQTELHFDEELLRHALGVTVVVRELADELALVLDDLHVVHGADVLVLLLPKDGRLLQLFVDEADLVAMSKARGYLREAFEVVAFSSQAQQFQWTAHIRVDLDVEAGVEFDAAGAIDDDVQVADELLLHLRGEAEVVSGKVHGHQVDFFTLNLSHNFASELDFHRVENLRILDLILVPVVGIVLLFLVRRALSSYRQIDSLDLREGSEQLFQNNFPEEAGAAGDEDRLFVVERI